MLLLLSKLVQSTAAGEHVSYMIALSITSMATVSTFLTLFFSWGGVCVDTLGYVGLLLNGYYYILVS